MIIRNVFIRLLQYTLDLYIFFTGAYIRIDPQKKKNMETIDI